MHGDEGLHYEPMWSMLKSRKTNILVEGYIETVLSIFDETESKMVQRVDIVINKGRKNETLNEVEPGRTIHNGPLRFPEKYCVPKKSVFLKKSDAYELEFFQINGE